MITAIMLIKATVDGMISRKFGRIVNITSSSVKAPIPVLGLSNGARSGLTGFVAGLARQIAAHNVTINNILPGRFDTDRLRSGLAFQAQKTGRPLAELEAESSAQVPAGRFGDPDEFGALCAFICGAHSQLHRRPELPDRRRRLSRHLLTGGPRRRGPDPGGPWNWWAHSPRWGDERCLKR